jgi:hypothetical protein
MRLVIAAVLAGTAMPIPAAADAALGAPRWNPRAPENGQVVPAFSYLTVEPVLNAIGARHRRAGADPGKPVLLVELPNGRKATLLFSSCEPSGRVCKALSIQSFWTKIANAPPADTARAIEAFNQKYAFAKAFLAADGRPALQRYLTADYGFVRGNLAVNLLNFASQAERFAIDVLRPLEAVKP